MGWFKSTYVEAAQGVLAIAPAQRLFESAAETNRHDLQRWLASLTAIYHVERMVALDIPWWNVAATCAVEDFLANRARVRVFEYGSGASTVWMARRGCDVTSVEHDGAWAARLGKLLPDSASLMHRPLGGTGSDYIRAIDEAGGSFDMIVVDGRRRVDCLNAAIPFLKADGIVLFDDSGRRRYRSGIADCGLMEQHFFGRSYCVPYPDHSSILTRRDPDRP